MILIFGELLPCGLFGVQALEEVSCNTFLYSTRGATIEFRLILSRKCLVCTLLLKDAVHRRVDRLVRMPSCGASQHSAEERSSIQGQCSRGRQGTGTFVPGGQAEAGAEETAGGANGKWRERRFRSGLFRFRASREERTRLASGDPCVPLHHPHVPWRGGCENGIVYVYEISFFS